MGWGKNIYRFFNRLEIDSPSNNNSLSAFLVEKLGLADLKISNQSFSFRDLFKYSYLKQTEIDNEDIMDEQEWAKNLKRKATFEIIFNIYDELLAGLKSNLKDKEEELKEYKIKFIGIKDFLTNTEIVDIEKYQEQKKKMETELNEQRKVLASIKADKGIKTNLSSSLQSKIVKLKTELGLLGETKHDQRQFISKLRLLVNQYQSEIDKKEMALEGYQALNKYEYIVCPNCLKPVNRPDSVESCCLCGSEKDDYEISELLVIKKEVRSLKLKIAELRKFINTEEIKYDEILKKEKLLKLELLDAELEIQHLYKDYVNPHIEQIEQLNYEIGKKNRVLLELDQSLSMLDELQRLELVIKSKEESIANLKDRIKSTELNAIDKQDVIRQLSNKFYDILSAFNFPKLDTAFIEGKTYLPYVRNRLYRSLGSLAGVTLITMAYYLAILLEACVENRNHLNLLIIDSPRKNLGAKAEQEEFKDEEIFNSIIRYFVTLEETLGDKIQLIVVNNGYPDFLLKKFIIEEFDGDGKKGLPYGLIDDAI
ncbi:hypothetical protein DEAC_c24040 [Desulfosporosinus acididurans]|uniref:Chromosome partition protein Smc n=1 Tax=Desulfosporosinus acididurans TaxID=476652 RepID=A0A0J1FQK3_9FIRM|nr:DNA recombination protein RecN [Desulfosporosinus acididurans]KLU65774.1 hypothetical protein DEAC_c24040 [Desulfosporosinus acididurans]